MRDNYYVEKLCSMPVRVYIVATGAGAGIQNKLWSTPGVSSVLAGASFPYAQDRTDALLGFKPDGYCNENTAIDLALAAYLRADDGTKAPIGLGLTAAVASRAPHKGDHRVHAAVVTQHAAWSMSSVLPKGGSERRPLDGDLADEIGFNLLMYAAGVADFPPNQPLPEPISDKARERFLARPLVTRDGFRKPAPDGGVVLFPGNFYPPHDGHFSNATSDTIFQITANPPHKPKLSLQDMLERVRHFRHRGDVLFLDGCGLYLEKAQRFPGSTLILGTDALRRMLDPKWGYEPEELLQAFKAARTTFLVACRDVDLLDNIDIPEWAREMFTALPRTKYSHLSSTQIRSARSA